MAAGLPALRDQDHPAMVGDDVVALMAAGLPAWRGWVAGLLAMVSLAACQSTQVVTAAGGTLMQAREVVRLVYSQSGEPGAKTLPYWSGDITPAVRRIMGRFSQSRGAYDSGAIGITGDGFLALREPGTADPALQSLVRHENLDRSILYAASALEVGHGSNDLFGDWMPYERATFAREWVAQAPAGWWHRNEKGEWLRKVEGPVATDVPPK